MRLPRRILRVLGRLWDFVVSLAAKLKLYPLDSFSGKAFATLEVFFVLNFIVAFLYVFGRWQNTELLVRGTAIVAPRPIIGLVLSAATFSVSYPLDRRGKIEGSLIRIGIRQYMRTATGLIALLLSFIFSLFVTYLIANPVTVPFFVSVLVENSLYTGPTGWSFWTRERQWTTLILFFLFVFAIFAIVLYWVFEKYNDAAVRRDLSIVETTDEKDDMTGLVLRNDTNKEVLLAKAKVRDSTGESYTLSHGPAFRPGEIGTISIPANFTLDKTEYEVPRGLTFVYDREKHSRIFTRAGDVFIIDVGE